MDEAKGAKIVLTINDVKVTARKGDNVLTAAKEAGITIPHLCYLRMHDHGILNDPQACRVCLVELGGGANNELVQACATEASEGMTVRTDTEAVRDARRKAIETLMSDHQYDCLRCKKNLRCDLQRYAAALEVRAADYEYKKPQLETDVSSLAVVREPNKCILCKRCESVCPYVQTTGEVSRSGRSYNTEAGSTASIPVSEAQCNYCGQCVAVCPTGALSGYPTSREIWSVLTDPEKYVIVQTAPSVRAAISEIMDLPAGKRSTGKMVAALKKLGFDKVLDTNFGADVTVVEESAELISRLENGGKLPMITSCCPAWVKFCEDQYPDLLPNLSTCKSPHEMFGAISKSYLAEKLGIKPSDMVCVSIMPCLAKNFEVRREELQNDGLKNVDIVLSTRDLCCMLKEARISLAQQTEEEFDGLMGKSSGAADIFGTTGGVMEAVLRTYSEQKTGKGLENIEFEPLRGYTESGVKEAEVVIGGEKLVVAAAYGLRNAMMLLDDIRSGRSKYHAIEMMACPGGCICGGGQPYHYGNEDILNKRRETLYGEDRAKVVRCSLENAELKALFDDYLGKPGGDKAHALLHTEFKKRQAP